MRRRPVVKTYDEALLKARLRQRRDELGLATREIADRADMSTSQVMSSWSPNIGRPIGLPVLVRLADALECSTDWLLGRDTFVTSPTGAPATVSARGGKATAPTVPLKSRSGAVAALTGGAA